MKKLKNPIPVPEKVKHEVSVRLLRVNDQYTPVICVRDGETGKVTGLSGSTADGIVYHEVTTKEHDKADVVQYKGHDYPIDRFLGHLKSYLEICPIDPLAIGLLDYFIPGTKPALPSLPVITDYHIEPVIGRGQPEGVLKAICTELKIEPAEARKRLRAAGLRAPYHDTALICKVLKG